MASEDRGYRYDAAWNLNQRTNNATTTTFGVDVKNQLTSVGGSTCVYDNNGNLTSSSTGFYTYAYDAENRLINWTFVYEHTAQTDFVYDGLGRLRKRVEYTWNSTNGWVVSSDTRYVYDGMRVIQERNGGNNTPTVSYTRGIDLSGTFEGAGGIGGLLARSHGYSSGSWTGHNFYHADGNGNVTMLIDNAGTPNVTATYRYDPYGNSITATGINAANNVYRFSSKEFHVKSGMYYYGYRFYDPNLHRWLNRDPIEEIGFVRTHLIRKTVRNGLPLNSEIRGQIRLYQPPTVLSLLVASQLYSAGWYAENSYIFVGNCPHAVLDPWGLSPCWSWGSFWGWGISGIVGGTIAGIPGGAEGMAFGAAGGFVAGAGGYSADYYFNSDAFESQSISAALGYLDWRDSLLDGIPPDQFDRNYRTLPGKYQ